MTPPPDPSSWPSLQAAPTDGRAHVGATLVRRARPLRGLVRALVAVLTAVLLLPNALIDVAPARRSAAAGTVSSTYYRLTYTANNTNVVAGTTVRYRYEIKNISAGTYIFASYPLTSGSSNAALTDDHCSGAASAAPTTSTGWSTNPNGDYYLPPGGTGYVECSATVNATTTSTAQIDRMAYGSSATPTTYSVQNAPVSTTETVTVASGADYRIAVTPSTTKVAPGADVAWSIQVSNAGATTSETFQLVHTLPVGFSAITSDDGCSVSGQTVTCPAQQAVSGGASRTYVVRSRAPTTAGSYTATTEQSLTTSGTKRTASTSVTVAAPPSDGTSNDGDFVLTKTPSVSSVPSGGASVTYSYTVRNTTSGRQYYNSGSDDKCSPIAYVSGMTTEYDSRIGRSFSYIPAGGTATFSCTSTVSQTTTNTATMTFSDSYAPSVTGGAVTYSGTSTATRSVTVTRDQPSGVGGQTCDALWYSSDERTASAAGNGTVGTLSTTTGAPTSVFDIGAQTGDPKNGSAAIAVDPGNPRDVYFIARESTTSTNKGKGLWVYDRSTDSSRLVTSVVPDNGSAVTRLGFDPFGLVWTIAANGHLYALRPSDASPAWSDRGLMTIPSSVGKMSSLQSGDLAFDGLGTMYFITSDVNSGRRASYLLTVSYPELADGNPNAKLAGRMGGALGFHGIALTENGEAYGSESQNLHRIDLATGAPTLVGSSSPELVGDLSSCALPRPLLRVTKTVSPYGPIRAGTGLTYTIRVENIGTLAATNVTLRDIPEGTAITTARLNSGSDLGATYFSSMRLVNSPNALPGVVAPGAAAVITLTATAGAGRTQVCNQSETTYEGQVGTVFSDDVTLPGTADKTCTPVFSPAIDVVKEGSTDTLDSTGADTSVTYTYAVRNVGNERLGGVTLTDDKCTSRVFLGGDTDGDALLTGSEIWRYQCTQTLTGTNGAGGAVRSTATVTAKGQDTNATVSDIATWLVTPPGLTFRKTSDTGGQALAPGDVVTYTLTARNTTIDHSDLTHVTVSDTPPAGTTYVPGSATMTSSTMLPRAAGTPPDLVTPEQNVTLKDGQTLTVTFKVRVDVVTGGGPTTLRNVATADSDQTNPSSDEVTDRVRSPVVDVTKAPGVITGPNASGQYTATYVVRVTNAGPGTAVVGQLTDTPRFASGLRPLTGTWAGPTGGSQALTGPGYGFPIGPATTTLAPSESRTYDVAITFEPTGSGGIPSCGGAGTATDNLASLPAGQETGPTGDDSACMNPDPRFALNKAADGGTPGGVGTEVHSTIDVDGNVLLTARYTVRIANAGLVAAVPPDVIDRVFVPAGFEITRVTLDGADATVTNSTVTIPGGSTALPVGGSGVRDVVVVVSARATTPDTTDWEQAGTCVVDNGEVVPPGGVINSVTTADAASSPTERPNDTDGRANNAGCVPFTPPSTSMTVVKLGRNCDVSQPTCHLPGSSFSLYRADPTTGAAPVVNGSVVDSGDPSRFGSAPMQMFTPYWVVERTAPAGHTLLPSPVRLSLGTNGIRLLEAADSAVTRVAGANGDTLEVVDDTPVTLPRTGGLGIWPALLAGSILVGIGTAALRRSGSRSMTRRGA